MAAPNKLGVPLKTVITKLGKSLNTTIAREGPGWYRAVGAIDREVLNETAQRIAEEGHNFPATVETVRIKKGYHESEEDKILHTTVALISKSGVVLNTVHIAKDPAQQQPLRLRRPSHTCLKPVFEQKLVVTLEEALNDDVLNKQPKSDAPKANDLKPVSLRWDSEPEK